MLDPPPLDKVDFIYYFYLKIEIIDAIHFIEKSPNEDNCLPVFDLNKIMTNI